ncbi:hypothetical protein [Actinokineospora inagensis]|uniref:hypothetical protein n=1 Tax=Actinokineospora inagensis TaxID=103730 RepID=UPI0004094765|nr:hypothetical protein [Actinokineospora inagensis]
MAQRLGHKQTAVMFILMGYAGEISNREMKARFGYTLDGKERRELNDLQFVRSEIVSRCFNHELTDSGWAWCDEEVRLATPPPPAAKSVIVAAQYQLMSVLVSGMERRRLRPADFLPFEVDVEQRVREAYQKLAQAPGEWVGLARLRSLLGDVPTEEVDEVLRELSRTRQVRLVPESNRKALTPADHEAAVRVGGEGNHLISIEAS